MTPAYIRRTSSVLCLSQFSKIFSSETTRSIEIKFHIKTSLDAGTKVCESGQGHMTKMAAIPIYVKNPLNVLYSRTRRLITLGLGM